MTIYSKKKNFGSISRKPENAVFSPFFKYFCLTLYIKIYIIRMLLTTHGSANRFRNVFVKDYRKILML